MVSRWVRSWDSKLLRPLLSVLAGIGVTPNMLTIGSLLCLVVAGVVVAQGHLLAADVLLLAGGIADGVDGELARQTDSMTSFGGFLDSICDHCGDYAFSLGLIWFYLSRQAETEVILVVVALFGSMLGSQVRSRAGMIGSRPATLGWSRASSVWRSGSSVSPPLTCRPHSGCWRCSIILPRSSASRMWSSAHPLDRQRRRLMLRTSSASRTLLVGPNDRR